MMTRAKIPVAELRGTHLHLTKLLRQMENEAPEAIKLPVLPDVKTGVALLGMSNTARIAGVTPQSVHSWVTAGFFPPDTWELLRPLIEEKGYRCPHKLWRMKEPVA
jgi:hypothetical protein